MPGVAQVLNVPVQVVPDPLDKPLGALGKMNPLAVAAKSPQEGHDNDRPCRHPEGPDGVALQNIQ